MGNFHGKIWGIDQAFSGHLDKKQEGEYEIKGLILDTSDPESVTHLGC